ncbi:MAG: glycosyltransferase family 4 protein [Anaerolineae bacterium]|nr:glycosyltransferase family 4 protein [Anaerolineae bacterium]
MAAKSLHIGFISTRLAGTDGVSLETAKWAHVLTELGHHCYYFAGESEWSAEQSYVVPEAHFTHPDVFALTQELFGDYIRLPQTSQHVQKLKEYLKGHLQRFVDRFKLDILIIENALAIPVHIPLGLAITEFIAETQIPAIAHHHDFAWERERFLISAANDYLRAAFPPVLPTLRHVVINSFAAHQLAMRTGERAVLIPNVMNFDDPPPPPDGYAADLRVELGVAADALLLLQPTRIVPRKQIERAIELTRRLDKPATLVITHESGDEGRDYADYLRRFADLLNTHVIFAADRFDYDRGKTADNRKIYSLADAYYAADLITYPSVIEGFGNAFLETIYFRRPILMRGYEIFEIDIKPKGFKVLTFQEFIAEATVKETQSLLNDPARITEIVEENYRIATQFYSFKVLRDQLTVLLNECMGT